MAIQYLSLNILCRFSTPAFLPAFKGSTLRGAFGHALKKVSCALKNQECQSCLLAKSCAYGLIFATEKLSGGRMSARPHPYVLNPPLTQQQHYTKDEGFSFNLVLLGPATVFLPHIVYAVEEMGKVGIGSGVKTGTGVFVLQAISTSIDTNQGESVVLYEERDKILQASLSYPRLELGADKVGNVRELTIELVTPLRIKEQNRLQGKIDFSTLVRAALRRVTLLEEHYGDGQLKLDYRDLLQQALAVQTSSQDIRWHEYKRYSNRQKQSMLLGGPLGHLHFKGDLAPFLPLFNYCRHINLGKQTAFGLGKIRMAALQHTDF